MSHGLKEYKADENFGNGLVYCIPEVEAVLAEKDRTIEQLSHKADELQHTIDQMAADDQLECSNLYTQMMEERFQKIHQKWHRCLARAQINRAKLGEYRALCNFVSSNKLNPCDVSNETTRFYDKWYHRWMGYANKLKTMLDNDDLSTL